MGAGKSYIAKRLAHHLPSPVIDLDVLIEQEAQKSIREIFEEEGEIYFRELEQQLLYRTLEQAPAIIALGGGTPVYKDNMDWIKQNGTSIFLDPPTSVLLGRLEKERAQRPLLAHLSAEEFQESIHTKLAMRRPVYEQADLCIKASAAEIVIGACLAFL